MLISITLLLKFPILNCIPNRHITVVTVLMFNKICLKYYFCNKLFIFLIQIFILFIYIILLILFVDTHLQCRCRLVFFIIIKR